MAHLVADGNLVAVAMTATPWIQAGGAVAPLFPGMWGGPTYGHVNGIHMAYTWAYKWHTRRHANGIQMAYTYTV